MDILDEINNKQFGKTPKKKTSTISNPNPSSSVQDTFSSINSQLNFEKNSRFKKQISSYQHLQIGKVQQFNLFQTPPESFKDSNSMSGNVNIPRLSKFQSSLGVIISEQSSEQSKRIVNMGGNKRHPQNTNKLSHKQMQQLKQKLKNESQKIIAQQSTIKQLKQKISDKQFQINELKQQIQRLDQRYHEERTRMLNEQSQLCNKEISRLNRLHEEEIKRREELMKWQSKKREDIFKLQIQSLSTTILKYKTLLQNESELSIQKQELNLKHEKQHSQNKNEKQMIGNLQRQLEKRAQILEEKKQEFYKQKREADKKYMALQKQMDQQKFKNKRECQKINQQIQQRLEKRQKQLDKKERVLSEKIRVLEYESKQLQIKKQLFQKEKEEKSKLNERIMLQNKNKLNEIWQQRQRISHLQRELLQKIAIVELRAQNRTFTQHINNKPIKNEQKKKQIKQIKQITQQIETPQSAPLQKNQIKLQQKQNKIDPNTKIDLGNYLQNLQKNRQNKTIKPIYKLHQFYK